MQGFLHGLFGGAFKELPSGFAVFAKLTEFCYIQDSPVIDAGIGKNYTISRK